MAEREMTQDECTRAALFLLTLLGADDDTKRAVRERCDRGQADAKAALDAIIESVLMAGTLMPL